MRQKAGRLWTSLNCLPFLDEIEFEALPPIGDIIY